MYLAFSMQYTRQPFVVFALDYPVLYKMPTNILGNIPSKIYLITVLSFWYEKYDNKHQYLCSISFLKLVNQVCKIMAMVCKIMNCTQFLCIIVNFIQVRKSVKNKTYSFQYLYILPIGINGEWCKNDYSFENV